MTKAWNGQEAVELFRKSEPGEFDVILMDIMMPVMNGYEATKMIRSLDREDAKEIPIIAMTANAFTEDRIRAKEAGMDEHVAKPVDVELLIKVIHIDTMRKAYEMGITDYITRPFDSVIVKKRVQNTLRHFMRIKSI